MAGGQGTGARENRGREAGGSDPPSPPPPHQLLYLKIFRALPLLVVTKLFSLNRS